MRNALGIFAVLVLALPSAKAAEVFVRQAQGTTLSSDQAGQLTDSVKSAVRQMPEHTLVQSEGQADFVLQPTLASTNGESVIRVEKFIDGDRVAMSEEGISSMSESHDQAIAATELAMIGDTVAESDMSTSGDTTSSTVGTESGVSTSPTYADSDETLSGTSSEVENGSAAKAGAAEAAVAGAAVGAASSSSGTTSSGAESRAAHPASPSDRHPGFFSVGLGPAFSLGMESDNAFYNLNLAYGYPLNEMFAGKVFADFNLATGDDSAHFNNFGVAAELYPFAEMMGGTPYITGDLGLAFVRDSNDINKDAPAVGAGVGYRFATEMLDIDVSAHYTFLTGQIDDQYPSIFGLRAALNF